MKNPIFSHVDEFQALGELGSLQQKLESLHHMLQGQHDFIDRIAIALYDAADDKVRTFVYSSQDDSPLTHYEASLAETPSLREVYRQNAPRVVNDLELFREGQQQHTQAINKAGYRASYTLPMKYEGIFFGFIFFNSRKPDVFDQFVLHELDVVGHMLMLLVYNERSSIRTLQATVKSALNLTHERDPETGCHLGRMSRYARLIARMLAGRHHLDDQFVEHVFLFSPLHDLGKIAIPDRILLKPDALSPEEFETMKTHSVRGRELIDNLLSNYGLDGIAYVDMLRNIAMHHHEAVDGSGYPSGLMAQDIPIEARIVAVADVFDALTSQRPYKPAWTNDAAFAALRDMAGMKLDAECVEALISQREAVEEIQAQYQEDEFG